MNNSNGAQTGGITFAGLLTILFIALKLTHVIDWSWLWVLSPIWISFAIGVAIILVCFVIALIKDSRHRR